MTAPNPECFHLSASCIKSFKACPTRYRLAYREGIRRAEDTDALRIGTNWHALHEVYRNALAAWEHPDFKPDPDGVFEYPHEFAMDCVVEHINEAYSQRPPSKTPDEWELERTQLMTSFVVYLWYYQDDEIEYLNQEYAFDLPVTEPTSGMPLPLDKAKRVGKIDHIVNWGGVVGPIERKSTTRPIDDGAEYWTDKQKDTQVSMYALAFRDAIRKNLLPDDLAAKVAEAHRAGNTIYDVWKRPQTKPKKLSAADTKKLVQSGEYFGEQFTVRVNQDDPEQYRVEVNDVEAEVTMLTAKKPTKKQKEEGIVPERGYAIHETVEMYAARLMQDMTSDPEKYFNRREIARTDRDLDKFESELFNVYQTQRLMDDSDVWFENEQQCRATFPCEFIPICYGCGADKVCDGETTPDGFRRIFVDLNIDLEGAE